MSVHALTWVYKHDGQPNPFHVMPVVPKSFLNKDLSDTIKVFSIPPELHFYDFSCLAKGWEGSDSLSHINFIIVLLIFIFCMYLLVIRGFVVEVKDESYG